MSAPTPPSRFRRFTAARLDPKAYLGLHVTLGFVVAALALWAFGALLDAVLDNATMVRWDTAAAAWVHARTTPAGLRVFDVITQLGSPVAMGLLAAVGAVMLWRAKHRTTLVAWLAAFAGDVAVNQAVKMAVHRARPSFGTAYLHGASYSFPSGHAMGSTVGYGMLAYVLAYVLLRDGAPRAPRPLIYALAATMVLLVGLSRVYLGVHYPSDVVGGFVAGAAWLAVCVTGAGIARRRMRVPGVVIEETGTRS